MSVFRGCWRLLLAGGPLLRFTFYRLAAAAAVLLLLLLLLKFAQCLCPTLRLFRENIETINRLKVFLLQ